MPKKVGLRPTIYALVEGLGIVFYKIIRLFGHVRVDVINVGNIDH
jgi:hypothetical protein